MPASRLAGRRKRHHIVPRSGVEARRKTQTESQTVSGQMPVRIIFLKTAAPRS
jgi:hypothetical protein